MKQKNKKSKKGIIIAAAVAVILIIAATAAAVNYESIAVKVTYALMPSSLETEVNDKTITFYKEFNKDYDFDKNSDQPLTAFNFYYYDENGEKVTLDGMDNYVDGDETVMPSLGFILKAKENSNIIKNVISKIMIVAVIVIIVLLIYLWYRSWSKREDAKKAKYYK